MAKNDVNTFFETEYGMSLNQYLSIETGNREVTKDNYPKRVSSTNKSSLNYYFKREYGMSYKEFKGIKMDDNEKKYPKKLAKKKLL